MLFTLYKRRLHFKTLAIIFLVAVVYFVLRFLFLKKNILAMNLIDAQTNKLSMLKVPKPHKRRTISQKNNDTKFILIWTPGISPFNCILESGQDPFLSSECEYTNCFLTSNREYLDDQTKFDAILFSILALRNLKLELPRFRAPKQKYVAVSKEPAPKYPITNPFVDGFFNWTWTYRTKSDVPWKFFRILDMEGEEIGPKERTFWRSDFDPVCDYVLDILFQKTRSVAWIVPECADKYRWDTYVKSLNKALSKFQFTVDIYGASCGRSCGTRAECHKLIEKEYIFYLALETYYDEDYVTDVLMTAMKNYAIPIVFVGSESIMYERYLPPGSYLDASKLNVGALAYYIKLVMDNFTLHQDYFKWTSHYFYESIPCRAEVCSICAALNNKTKVEEKTVYEELRTWWNGKPVLSVQDMIISIFLRDRVMLNLTLERNYPALLRLFQKNYLAEFQRNRLIDIELVNEFKRKNQISIDWFFSGNFTTTDSNTADVADPTETTDLVDDD